MKKLLAWSIMLVILLGISMPAGAECAHKWEVLGGEEATCIDDGYTVKRCVYCGETKKETVKATGKHDWQDQYELETPTCTQEGSMRTICKDCKILGSYVIPATGHEWKYIYYNKPTCVEFGSMMEECIYCGIQQGMGLPPTDNHNWYDVKEIEGATCQQTGTMSIKCRDCGKTSTREIKKTDHSYTWNITVNATDNTKGTRVGTCKHCGKELTEQFYPEGTLYRGIDSKNEVQLMQEKLIVCGYLNDKADGIFGKNTEQAVKNFQNAESVRADGIAWPETLKLLDAAYARSGGASAVSTPAPVSGEDEAEYTPLDVIMIGGGVVSTANVNLRSGPGLDYSIIGTVSKDTPLGRVLDSAIDDRGIVWFMVNYKGVDCWVSTVYSKLYTGNIDYSMDRLPFPESELYPSEYYLLEGGMELMNYYMCNFDIVCSALYLEDPHEDEDGLRYTSNWAITVNGYEYADYFVLMDGSYTVYGAKLGMNIEEVKALLAEKGLYFRGEDGAEEIVTFSFVRAYQPDSLYADENCFDLEILVQTDIKGTVHTIFIRTLGK